MGEENGVLYSPVVCPAFVSRFPRRKSSEPTSSRNDVLPCRGGDARDATRDLPLVGTYVRRYVLHIQYFAYIAAQTNLGKKWGDTESIAYREIRSSSGERRAASRRIPRCDTF